MASRKAHDSSGAVRHKEHVRNRASCGTLPHPLAPGTALRVLTRPLPAPTHTLTGGCRHGQRINSLQPPRELARVSPAPQHYLCSSGLCPPSFWTSEAGRPFLSQPGLLLHNAQYLKGSLDHELIQDRKHASLPLAFPAPGTWHSTCRT